MLRRDLGRAVARAYGAYDDASGVARRALFVIDGDGIIRHKYIGPITARALEDTILPLIEDLQGEAS